MRGFHHAQRDFIENIRLQFYTASACQWVRLRKIRKGGFVMKWSKERIWEWYHSRAWIRGCNYMSADCANRIDQWQAYQFEEHYETTKKELALMAELGYNSIRIIPEFIVWLKEHDGFMERFEKYVALAAQNGISCMVVLGNDCAPPREEALKRMQLGEQHVDWGYHGGRKVSQHGKSDGSGYSLLDEPEYAEKYDDFVREIVERYKNDERIIIWDVFNEPGNSKRNSMSLSHLERFIQMIRAIDPIQPLTVGIWSQTTDLDHLKEIEKYGLENSDIISYHNYKSYEDNIREIKLLKGYGRPLINTEWLNRCGGNTIEALFPLFYLEKVGCYHWGFVAGKYQTFEPHNGVWDAYKNDPGAFAAFDFTKWFHDIYRPSHNPYDPKETELIKRFCDLADKDAQIE